MKVNFNLSLKHISFTSIFSLLLLVTSNTSQAAEPVDRIAAIVNNDVIMLSELEQKIRTITSQIQQSDQPLPPPSVLEKQLLERIILTRLQLQRAEQSGIRVDDETLNRSVSNMASQNGVSLKEFRNILEGEDYSFEKFREDIRNEIAISRLRQREVVNRITVSDREIDNSLANAETQGLTEVKYHIGHILIAVPENSSDEEILQRRLIAEAVISDLNEGQDFTEIAIRLSDGQQAAEGGDLGWRTMSQVPSLFSAHIINMQAGTVSEIIDNASGFHIIKVHDVSSGDKNMVSQTRASHVLLKISEIMTSEQAQEKLQQFLYRMEQGEDFSQIARSNSEDMISALEGGDLGWRSPGELVPQFEKAMNELKIGEIGNPFQSQFGWHIVKVNDRRDFDNTDNAKRTRAREAIRQRKIKESEQVWLQNLREEAYVQYKLNE